MNDLCIHMCMCVYFTSSGNVSPACDPAIGAIRKMTGLSSQTHWSDVVSEADRAFQMQQSDVIVIGELIVIGVKVDL